jgi:hypothetical protein
MCNQELVNSLKVGQTLTFVTSADDPFINKKFFVSHPIKIKKINESNWKVADGETGAHKCEYLSMCLCHYYSIYLIGKNLDEWFMPYLLYPNIVFGSSYNIPAELTCL